MTTTLKPHDFYLKMVTFCDKYIAKTDTENHIDELEYLKLLVSGWEKWRFAETNELSFAHLRNYAIDNAPDAELMQTVVELIDAHIEENLLSLFPAHGTNVRKIIGIPEPVKPKTDKE